MMTQTLAIVHDAYRELQSKKMFWIILCLNLLAVGAFALVGVSGSSITILGKEFQALPTAEFALIQYKGYFSNFVVGFWFTWVATLLALISTAGIFPDFLASGSIDLYLARPIGRLRLFLTKYMAGLLFVGLQVVIFTVLSFLVLGVRAGAWEPGLFLAIPLVLIFFSYLYGLLIFIGTLTRSTIAALLLTLLAWGGIFALDIVDAAIGVHHRSSIIGGAIIDEEIERIDSRIAAMKPDSSMPASAAATQAAPFSSPDRLRSMEAQRERLLARRHEMTISDGALSFQRYIVLAKTPFPKTRETMGYLDKVLFSDKDLQAAIRPIRGASDDSIDLQNPPPRVAKALEELDKLNQARSAWWVIGTSLLFEGVCLVLAAWHFCTRDF